MSGGTDFNPLYPMHLEIKVASDICNPSGLGVSTPFEDYTLFPLEDSTLSTALADSTISTSLADSTLTAAL